MSWYPIVLLGLAGFLIGGAVSFAKQRAWIPVVILVVLAALAGVGSFVWWGTPA